MRIIYTFRNNRGFWIVNCPSDKSIKEASYSSLIEAINFFFSQHKGIEYFDVVLPLSMPTPIPITKSIRKAKTPIKDKPVNNKSSVILNHDNWRNKPVPDSTIVFKYGMKWVAIVPPYGKENIYYLQNPLPGTRVLATGKGSASKTVQMISGTLEQALFIDFGWSKARIYPDGQELKIEFTGGASATKQRWMKETKLNEHKKHKDIKGEKGKRGARMIDRLKRFFNL